MRLNVIIEAENGLPIGADFQLRLWLLGEILQNMLKQQEIVKKNYKQILNIPIFDF